MMGYQLVDIYDNVVEDHVAELIHTQIKDCAWKFDYHSNKRKPNKHWHILAGHDETEIKENNLEIKNFFSKLGIFLIS